MNKIFLDIGNSYIKWASVTDEGYALHEPLTIEEVIDSELSAFDFDEVIDEVYFSSVGNSDGVDALKSLIQSEWQILPIQLTSQKSCCGLTSGYDNFSQLGDDRWFAMLGGVDMYSQPIVVVDAGTAITIDAVVEGQHLGGLIVPGLYTMRKSLATNTADLADYSMPQLSESESTPTLLATDTASAILGGTLYMTASFINQVIDDLNRQLETQLKVLLTGGEAPQLLPLLDEEVEFIPDLILQGMVAVEESVKKQ